MTDRNLISGQEFQRNLQNVLNYTTASTLHHDEITWGRMRRMAPRTHTHKPHSHAGAHLCLVEVFHAVFGQRAQVVLVRLVDGRERWVEGGR